MCVCARVRLYYFCKLLYRISNSFSCYVLEYRIEIYKGQNTQKSLILSLVPHLPTGITNQLRRNGKDWRRNERDEGRGKDDKKRKGKIGRLTTCDKICERKKYREENERWSQWEKKIIRGVHRKVKSEKNEWISKRRKPQRMNGNRKLKNDYMTTEKKTHGQEIVEI